MTFLLAALLLQDSSHIGKIEWGPVAFGGAADPVHPGAQQINNWQFGVQIGLPVTEAVDFFGEFDYMRHAPTERGHHFDMIQFLIGMRLYPFERPGFYFMLGAGQSWNSNDDDRFEIKQVQTHFNWGTHAAIGWRLGLSASTDLLLEVRFSHWSNGSFTGDRNFGLNDLLLGATFSFR